MIIQLLIQQQFSTLYLSLDLDTNNVSLPFTYFFLSLGIGIMVPKIIEIRTKTMS